MKGIEINEAWTAPTIRELAQKMGVDPDGLEKTIRRYNDEFVKNGKDTDFGKTPVNLTKRIEVGPFWACYTGMTVHHTMGGLSCNVKAQVLDWQGRVVPRLYAAGEITGGIHGTNRPESIGTNASHGCIRMRVADAEALYARVPNGTVVVIECGAYGELGGSLRTLKNGDRSSMVRAVQRKLRALGFYFGTPDGIFGSATQRAVNKARETFNLSANGLVDWALYQKLGLTLFE